MSRAASRDIVDVPQVPRHGRRSGGQGWRERERARERERERVPRHVTWSTQRRARMPRGRSRQRGRGKNQAGGTGRAGQRASGGVLSGGKNIAPVECSLNQRLRSHIREEPSATARRARGVFNQREATSSACEATRGTEGTEGDGTSLRSDRRRREMLAEGRGGCGAITRCRTEPASSYPLLRLACDPRAVTPCRLAPNALLI